MSDSDCPPSLWWNGEAPAEGEHDESQGCIRDRLPQESGSRIPSHPQRSLPKMKPHRPEGSPPQHNPQDDESVNPHSEFQELSDSPSIKQSIYHLDGLTMDSMTTVPSLAPSISSFKFDQRTLVFFMCSLYFILIIAAIVSLFVWPLQKSSQLRQSRRRQGKGVISGPIKHD